MPIGDPGEEQFRNAIVEYRNHHISAILTSLFLFRMEVLGSEDLADRGGLDEAAQKHFRDLLYNCDRWRRRVTYNPDQDDLGDIITKAVDVNEDMHKSGVPMRGEEIQSGSVGLHQLPYAIDGTDEDIPLKSVIKIKGVNGMLLLGAIDATIVAVTRLNSRDRSKFITQKDSLRVYGNLCEILEYLDAFGGDDNQVDVVQVLPSEEPRGPDNSPNRKTETAGGSPAG